VLTAIAKGFVQHYFEHGELRQLCAKTVSMWRGRSERDGGSLPRYKEAPLIRDSPTGSDEINLDLKDM
jgi:hypothetical protein